MRTLTVRIESNQDFFARARAAGKRIDAGGGYEGEEYSFATLPLLLETFSPNRWTLIQMLQSTGPSTLRGLSRALHRDVKRVHGDVAVLLEKGIVERNDSGKLYVPYDRVHIDVELRAPAAA
jgi:predicted transcriptional regulator